MKPDPLDKKIQEAAAHNESSFTEEAWRAMEKILDEKMPQQKKHKRKFFWWLLIPFGIAGGLIILTNGNKPNESEISTAQTKPLSDSLKSSNTKTAPSISNKTIRQPRNTNDNDSGKIGEPVSTPTLQATNILELNGSKKHSQRKDNKRLPQHNNTAPLIPVMNNMPQENDGQRLSDLSRSVFQIGIPIQNETFEFVLPGLKEKLNTPNYKPNDHPMKKETAEALKNSNAQKHPKKFSSRFAIGFSIGPDASFVNLKNTGAIKGVYGAGLSYNINKRLTARTGFYVSRKIYGAPPSTYDPPQRFWNYYPYLKHIDADCKIFEVPIILNYQFLSGPKHHWFTSVGISSYFMKTESYNYFSKDPAGQSWYNNYSIKNKNQHFLSSLRLSAGYERKFNSKVSIAAEPYVNLPFSGIGYGKVKLYSTGVLFTISAKPFSNK